MDREKALYELRAVARQAVIDEAGERKRLIDLRISAACKVLGIEKLDDIISDDLTDEAKAFFKSLIDERVMWDDLSNEVWSILREITASIQN